ncbi:MAG: helix-turn-helix transcriptional regulator [Thalassotalea sp.]
MTLLALEPAFKFIMMPFISAQLLVMVLIYFTIVRKRISALYKWYFCFIATVILFLIGRAAEEFVDYQSASSILYTRVFLLFSIGMPSLIVASAIYTGIKKSYFLYVAPYIVGIIFSVCYFVTLDVQRRVFISPALAEQITALVNISHNQIQFLAVMVLSVIPYSYFFVKALIYSKGIKDLVVLLGALIFGLLFAAGSYWWENYWIYYAGSIVPALCWAWVLFKDINEMKGKVGLLKDELYELAQSGNQLGDDEVEKLLSEIEHLSSNNLTIYKHRLREILSRLTDNTIEAGGDSDHLLSRYSQQEKAIEQVIDTNVLRKIARDEVVGLSKIISEIPNQRIERVKKYLTDNYQENIEIDQLASQFNVSRSYLMREFKKLTTKTVNQFLTNRRIEVAKNLLKEHTVTDTAFAVGFNNSNYFSTVFKKSTGQTPVMFQQSIR